MSVNHVPSSLREALRQLVADQQQAASYENASLSAQGLAASRAGITKNSRHWVLSEVRAALRDAEQARQALNDQIAADLAPSSDPQVNIARELTWNRLSARIAAGATVDTLAASASAHELATLATIGVAELPEGESQYISAAVNRYYPNRPEVAELYSDLQLRVVVAEQDAGLARAAFRVAMDAPLDASELQGLQRGDPELFAQLDDADQLPPTNIDNPFGRPPLTAADVADADA